MPLLQILIGTSKFLANNNHNHPILQEYKSTIQSVWVPKNPPQSEQEFTQSNKIWPIHYYPLKTQEHQQKQLVLTEKEMKQMKYYIEQSMKEKMVIIVNPILNSIISTSQNEQQKQQQNQRQSVNPLATPILYSIQGVSRQERERMLQDHDDTDDVDTAGSDDEANITTDNGNHDIEYDYN